MIWGQHAEFLAGLPPEFDNTPVEPDVEEWCASFFAAFRYMNHFRPRSMMGDPMMITEDQMVQYAARRGPHDVDGLEEFIAVITALDGAYLVMLAEQRPKK